MKPLTLILAFTPLIVFSLLARLLPHGDIGVAALVAVAAALIAMAMSRPFWPPKIINACSLVMFAVLTILGFSLGSNDDRWLATWGGAGVGLVLGLVILALIPVMPFTEQFARESTPQAYWGSPTFKKINRVLSTGWGVAIFALGASRVVGAVLSRGTASRVPELLFGLAIPVVVILYMLKFSKSYPDRVTHHEEPAAQARS
jgi:uncharacterized membrane protein YfcA